MNKTNAENAIDDLYVPLSGFEEEQAALAAGREADYEVPQARVTSEIKRNARREHCLAIPTRGVTADGIPFLHFGQHQVMQSWETPYMQRLAEHATSALDKGDVLELGYGMGISGGFVQAAIAEWNKQHPLRKRAHHMCELNLDVAADCIRRNTEAIAAGSLILHVGDWRELLTGRTGEVTLLEPATIANHVAAWCAQPLDYRVCHHVIAMVPDEAIWFMERYKDEIADARLQLHVGDWPLWRSRLQAGGVVQNRASLLAKKGFGGALLDTYALTADERHFNQIPALKPVRELLADGAILTYYGDAEKDFQPAHRQALIDAGFHPDNIDCLQFSFERYAKGTAYLNKYNKLSSMIVPVITAGPPKHGGQKLVSSHSIGYTQPDGNKYHRLARKSSLAYSNSWFRGQLTPFTEEDLVSLANKVQRLWERFGDKNPKAGRIIEVGSGPNLGNAIAAAPFCDEYAGLERSAANVALATDWVEGRASDSAAMWEGWRLVAGLCFAHATKPGGQAVKWLSNLKATLPEMYEVIRSWNKLPEHNRKKMALLSEARAVERKTGRRNPFLAAASITEQLKGKTRFVTADLIGYVDGDAQRNLANAQPFVGTADAVLANYVHESVNPVLLGVAHSMLNAAKLAKPGGLIMNTFMEKTFRYEGFLTAFDECYASAGVFRALQEQVAIIEPEAFNHTRINPSEAGTVVRLGYQGVVEADGTRKPALPQNGEELLEQLRALHSRRPGERLIALRIRSAGTKNSQRAAPSRLGYCLASERATFEAEMTAEYGRLYDVDPSSIEVALASPDYSWVGISPTRLRRLPRPQDRVKF